MTEYFDTVVIGAGQAGLATSYYLTQHGQDHVVLEKARIGEAWRSGRWDSFTLVTPNWTLRLPGFAYQGGEPDGFLAKEEVSDYLDRYVRYFNPPVRTGIEVTGVDGSDDGFTLQTSSGVLRTKNVVVATGSMQHPKIPAFAAQLPPHALPLHSSQYRNPSQLPAGAVLVVGGGQSGCQIAHELCQEGRKVYLSSGKVGSLPRRYRGRDVFWWAEQLGVLNQHVSKLPSPAARFVGNPQLTGKDGGYTLNLHRLAEEGVTLLGRATNADGSQITFAADLKENLAYADRFDSELRKGIDEYIAGNGLNSPADDEPRARASYDVETILALDLNEAGVGSIIWATGYSFDFSWLHFPIFDQYGYPKQERGITSQPGLFFVGLQWLYAAKSPLFIGVGEDAEHVVKAIVERVEVETFRSSPQHLHS